MTSASQLLAPDGIAALEAASGEIRTAPCPHCGTPHDYPLVAMFPKIVPVCDSCATRQQAVFSEASRRDSWLDHYHRHLPPGYHGAARDKVLARFHRALAWEVDATGAGNHRGGIGFVGESGIGKSHAMACVLRGLRKRFRWWSGTEARQASIDAATADRHNDEARRHWESAMTVEILVPDDISQGVMTAAWSSKLFDLLEARLGHALPTFWTSQIPLEDLRAKIIRQNGGDKEQASAISRRLGQHSLVLGG